MSNDWIEWSGGKCPVTHDAVVEVKFRDPNFTGAERTAPAAHFQWYWTSFELFKGGEIIAYRVVTPSPSSELTQLRAEVEGVSRAIGTVRLMDPPDGGDVSLAEQVRRMAEALQAAEAEATALRERRENVDAFAVDAFVETQWQGLLDADDRTSPEEYPDMVLITRGDLGSIIEAFAALHPAGGEDDGR